MKHGSWLNINHNAHALTFGHWTLLDLQHPAGVVGSSGVVPIIAFIFIRHCFWLAQLAKNVP